MKKYFLIIFLIFVIVFFTYKIFNSAVVTKRKIEQPKLATEVTKYSDSELNKTEENINESTESPLKPEFRLNSDERNINSEKDLIQKKEEHFSDQPAESENSKTDILYSKSNNKSPSKSQSKPEFHYIQERGEHFYAQTPERENIGRDRPYSAQNNKSHHRVQQEPEFIYNKPPKSPQKENGLLMCTPYKEKLKTEYMGMNVEYTVEISGWINKKCILNFSMDILNPGSTFESTYGVSDDMVEIFGFAPKVRCEFSKQQLLYVGDSILEEKQKDRKMLKNPDQINLPDFSDLSFSDMKLLQVILNDRACKILNSNEIFNMLENLF